MVRVDATLDFEYEGHCQGHEGENLFLILFHN